jgi:plastocyanin
MCDVHGWRRYRCSARPTSISIKVEQRLLFFSERGDRTPPLEATVQIPKILFVVPALAAAALLPGLTTKLPTPDENQVGMTQEAFSEDTITIVAGAKLTFVNNSHFLHVLAPGEEARLTAQNGVPKFDDRYNTHIAEAGDQYTTTAWNSPGTYHLTCTLHPEMTITVVVLPHH